MAPGSAQHSLAPRHGAAATTATVTRRPEGLGLGTPGDSAKAELPVPRRVPSTRLPTPRNTPLWCHPGSEKSSSPQPSPFQSLIPRSAGQLPAGPGSGCSQGRGRDVCPAHATRPVIRASPMAVPTMNGHVLRAGRPAMAKDEPPPRPPCGHTDEAQTHLIPPSSHPSAKEHPHASRVHGGGGQGEGSGGAVHSSGTSPQAPCS